MSVGEFPWAQVLPCLSRNKTVCRGILGHQVATQGSGPYDESDFDEFLDACGVEVRHVAGGEVPPSVIILGREDWSGDDIDELFLRTDGDVRVYSQEMVVASMAIGTDIFELLGEGLDLMDVIADHPALERWHYAQVDTPVLESPASPPPMSTAPHYRLIVNFDAGEWPASGVLSQMGYHVGQSGLAPGPRRAILEQVVGVELVAVSQETLAYIQEWGAPSSRQRLQKMANCLTGFARGARRKSNANMSEAIGDWESDLEWLIDTYGL